MKKNKILKTILCLLAVGCVFLAGCNGAKEDDASPADTEDVVQTDEPTLGNSDINGTWGLLDPTSGAVLYLSFEDGGVSYSVFGTEYGESLEGGGSYTIKEDGVVFISVDMAGEVYENTYNVEVSGDTLNLSLAEGETAVEDGFSLAGTYVKSELPESPEPSGQETDAAATDTQATNDANTDASASPSGNDVNTASLLANKSFLADTDTFLGDAYEGEVTGYFELFDSDRIEGAFYVSISGSSIGQLDFYIDGDVMYFSNSPMGTSGKFTFGVTDKYLKISQIESDASGEDLLNCIEGTWNAQ